MKYQKMAEEILALVGQENIKSVTHCMTRLRLVLKDEKIVDDNAVKAVKGVLGVAHSGGQYQIIIGNDVTHVYQEFVKLTGLEKEQPAEKEAAEKEEQKEKLTLKSVGNRILNYMAGSLTPLIPLFYGSSND